ncbi:beta-propeller domain-containing protein [Marinicrinis sediminis]|uniref:Beta-propeller domain-containing protein n=1 Tax=Marinicrinis sediminis TaxID=1652465 RepID=A0ABW5RBZ6_9BACL
MFKRSATWILMVVVALSLVFTPLQKQVTNASTQTVKLYMNNSFMPHIVPELKQDTVYIPLRNVSVLLGMQVEWLAAEKTAIVSSTEKNIKLKPNQSSYTVNGQKASFSHTPYLKDQQMMVPLRWLSTHTEVNIKWDQKSRAVHLDISVDNLPTLSSYAHLKTLLKQMENSPYSIQKQSAMQNERSEDSADTADAGGDYSETNTQVEGVDEADTVKTDGTYIYQLQQQQLFIFQANPANEMKLVGTYTIKDQSFNPHEFYLDAELKQAVIIGNSYKEHSTNGSDTGEADSGASMKKMIFPRYGTSFTEAQIVDLSDITNPVLTRTLELEGHYVQSRMIDHSLYLVTNQYLDVYTIMQEEGELPGPVYRDSSKSEQPQNLNWSDVKYFPGPQSESNLMNVAAVNLQTGTELKVESFVGSGQNVYASKDHLYVAVQKWRSEPNETSTKPSTGTDDPLIDRMWVPQGERYTQIYKFGLASDAITYAGQGEVKGGILNQFSMDEHNGFFRIATTTGDMWRSNQNTSKNHVFVLNPNLQQVGSVEDLAPGERIYSVRFMGEKAYVVTFKQVDPLFVLDMANPASPKVLGELKIPGYSDYLHPYDEQHLIGFGKDTIELPVRDSNGKQIDTQAYYTGMKIALFDVSNFEQPREVDHVIIGDRGTYSELLHNHKALLMNAKHDIMAFPVTVMEVKGAKVDAYGFPAYGEQVYQGAYVYHIDPEKGFTLKTRITHQEAGSADNQEAVYHEYMNHIERILYIDDVLYTLSKKQIKATDLNDYSDIGTIDIPVPEQKYDNRIMTEELSLR